MNDKGIFQSVGKQPTDRLESCLLGNELHKQEYDYERHDRIRYYCDTWEAENVLHRVGHLDSVKI